jgi:hypothetical protein
MALTSSQRKALKLLADAGDGCTVPALVRSGCTLEELRHLARSRLTITERVREPGSLRAYRNARPHQRRRAEGAGPSGRPDEPSQDFSEVGAARFVRARHARWRRRWGVIGEPLKLQQTVEQHPPSSRGCADASAPRSASSAGSGSTSTARCSRLPFVFVSERGSPFTTTGLARMIERAAAAAGLSVAFQVVRFW